MPRARFDVATDYYTILGVSRGATAREILAAYRRLAKACHPDLNQGLPAAATRMARLNVAKSVLLEPATRAAYDAARRSRFELAHATRRTSVAAATARRPPAPPTASHPPRRSGGFDRQTAALLALVLPLVGALLFYVVDAAQVAARPTRAPAPDLALAPISRPTTAGTARTAFSIVVAAGEAPNRRAAVAASAVIGRLSESAPEAELLRAAGRRLLQAASTGDTTAWREATYELCVLAGSC